MKKAIIIHTSDFRGDHASDILKPLIIDDSITVKQLLDMINIGEYITITHDFKPQQ